jgi:hypothetical protein
MFIIGSGIILKIFNLASMLGQRAAWEGGCGDDVYPLFCLARRLPSNIPKIHIR